MFKKILVPMDLTATHEHTVGIAAELAKPSRGKVTLLHVIELIEGVALSEDREFYERLENKARIHLEPFQSRLEELGISARALVVYGNRTEQVLRTAQEMQADLIVLTSHRIDPGTRGAGWGTLSYKIGILAACPVLLVK
jgi:nucleotide-binding universal stress UspA family protein